MRFSISQLKKFLRCPYSYKLYYKDGIKLSGNVNLAVGRAVHKGFEVALKSIKNLGVFDLQEVMSAIKGEYQSLIDDGTLARESEERIKEGWDKIELAEQIYKEYPFPEKSEIIAVEEKFVKADILDVEIVGYPDLITTDCVYDFKVKFRTPSEVSRGDYLQVGFYTTFGDTEKAALVYIVLTKTPKVVVREFTKQELETARNLAKDLIPSVYAAIKEAEVNGHWLAVGFGSDACSWCEYAQEGLCEYGCGGKIKVK